MLVDKIKGILPSLISPNQNGFVPGRHITDNIVIAEEMNHSMRHMKSKIGYMDTKVDLEKAYDKLNWKFIEGY